MKARNRILLQCCLLLSVALTSCQQEIEPEPIEEIIPLQVGNRWNYQVINYYASGEVVDTTSYTRVVVRDTLIQNSRWYVLSDGYMVRNSGEGYVYYNIAGKQAVILYQSPSYGGIGYGYQYPLSFQYVLTTRSYELAPVPNSPLSLEAYLFKIEYQNTDSGLKTTTSSFKHDYISPGVGLVRSDTFFEGTDKIMRRHELKSYLVQ